MLLTIRTLLTALALLAAASLRPLAAATDGTFVSLGGLVFSDPSCAADGTGTAVCAAMGQDSAVIVNRYAAGKWTGWTALTGTAGGKPGCARIAAGRVVCAVRNGQNRLVAYQFAAGTWSGPVTAGLLVPLSTDPSCAGLAANHALCAGLDVNGAVQAATFDGATWKLVPAVPTTALSPVACSPDDRGHAFCVWTTTANGVLAMEYNGTKWLPAVALGGRAAGPPACTDSGLTTGAIVCYVTSTDSGLYSNVYDGAKWGGWQSAGGSMIGYGCAEDSAHHAVAQYRCVATGVFDGTLWLYTAGQLWASLGGGPVIGTPSCVALNTTVFPGQVMCVVQTIAHTADSIILPGGP